MDFYLVCVHPFANYAKGQQVTDETEIKSLLADDRINFFVRVAAPPAPVEEPGDEEEEEQDETEYRGE